MPYFCLRGKKGRSDKYNSNYHSSFHSPSVTRRLLGRARRLASVSFPRNKTPPAWTLTHVLLQRILSSPSPPSDEFSLFSSIVETFPSACLSAVMSGWCSLAQQASLTRDATAAANQWLNGEVWWSLVASREISKWWRRRFWWFTPEVVSICFY